MSNENQSPCSNPLNCSPTGKEWCIGKCQKSEEKRFSRWLMEVDGNQYVTSKYYFSSDDAGSIETMQTKVGCKAICPISDGFLVSHLGIAKVTQAGQSSED